MCCLLQEGLGSHLGTPPPDERARRKALGNDIRSLLAKQQLVAAVELPRVAMRTPYIDNACQFRPVLAEQLELAAYHEVNLMIRTPSPKDPSAEQVIGLRTDDAARA